MIPGKPLDYFWEDHGLRLYIPADALDASTPTLTMKIQASLSGQFKLPDDMELVSGVYWISFPSEELKQPITLELQHCAHLEQTEQTRLSFVTSKSKGVGEGGAGGAVAPPHLKAGGLSPSSSSHATYIPFLTRPSSSQLAPTPLKSNQETLPYKFEPLDGGVFSSKNDYGSIQIKHFCGIAVASKANQSHSREQEEGGSDEKTAERSVAKKYVALTYYTQAKSTRTTWKMYFTVIPSLALRLKVSLLGIWPFTCSSLY